MNLLNVLEGIVAIFTLGKQVPAPVHLIYVPPVLQRFPPGVLKNEFEADRYWLSIAGIENHSDQVLPKTRIKLTVTPSFPPEIGAADPRRPPGWSYDAARNEITIENLDPGDQVFFSLFSKGNRRPPDAAKPTVIVGERKVSRLAATLGAVKRQPALGAYYLLVYVMVPIVMIGGASVLGFILYQTFSPTSDRVFAQRLVEDVGTSYTQTVLEGEDVNDKNLARHRAGEDLLLKLNKVSTKQELLAKDRIMILEK